MGLGWLEGGHARARDHVLTIIGFLGIVSPLAAAVPTATVERPVFARQPFKVGVLAV